MGNLAWSVWLYRQGGTKTYAILLMMHDNLLQSDKGASSAQPSTVNLTKQLLV